MAVGKGKQMTEDRISPYPILSYPRDKTRWLVGEVVLYFVFKGGRSPSQHIFQAGFLAVGVSFVPWKMQWMMFRDGGIQGGKNEEK